MGNFSFCHLNWLSMLPMKDTPFLKMKQMQTLNRLFKGPCRHPVSVRSLLSYSLLPLGLEVCKCKDRINVTGVKHESVYANYICTASGKVLQEPILINFPRLCILLTNILYIFAANYHNRFFRNILI